MRGAHVHVLGAQGAVPDPSRPIAFLDRDGVLNMGREGYVNGPDELTLLPDAGQSVGALKRAGYLVCVVTNQSPVMRGLWGLDRLEQIHTSLQEQLLAEDSGALLDAVITCPHRRRDNCGCRKPQPGMLALGHRLLRTHDEPTLAGHEPGLHPAPREAVAWWSPKPRPPHPLDAMVGDRRSDMGAGWAVGARLFHVSAHLGVSSVVDRVVNDRDGGDLFEP